MAGVQEPLKHAQHGLQALHAWQVEDPQVGPPGSHEAACDAEGGFLRHVHEQQAGHECHALTVPNLEA